MADKLRWLNTKIWIDPWFQSLDVEQSYLFIYLLTNSYINTIGIYEISITTIQNETKIASKEKIEGTLEKFATDKKIYYDRSYVVIENFRKHQCNDGMPTQKGLLNCFNGLPVEVVVRIKKNNWAAYLFSMMQEYSTRYNIPLAYQKPGQAEIFPVHQEPEKPNKNQAIIEDILNYWNSLDSVIKHKAITGLAFRNGAKALKDYSPEDIKNAMKNYSIILSGCNGGKPGGEYKWNGYSFAMEAFFPKVSQFIDDTCLTNWRDTKFATKYKEENPNYGKF